MSFNCANYRPLAYHCLRSLLAVTLAAVQLLACYISPFGVSSVWRVHRVHVKSRQGYVQECEGLL